MKKNEKNELLLQIINGSLSGPIQYDVYFILNIFILAGFLNKEGVELVNLYKKHWGI